MDYIQTLIIVTLCVVTILAIVVAVQLVLLLQEAHRAVKKVNRIISGFEGSGASLSTGLKEVAGFLQGFKTLLKVIEVSSSFRKK